MSQPDETILLPNDRKQILKPLSKKDPAGPSWRYEDEYDQVQTARKFEENLPQGVWQHSRKEADWDKVEKLCLDVLKTKSKDLQMCLWLTEALMNKYQIAGLSAGLSLTKDFLKTFFDCFHPFSKDDPEYRVLPLLWADKEFSKKIIQFPVNSPEGHSTEADSFWTYQAHIVRVTADQSKAPAIAEKEQQERSKAFYEKVTATPTHFYQDLALHLEHAKKDLLAIETLIEKNYPEFPGCLMNLKARIESMLHFAAQTCQTKGVDGGGEVKDQQKSQSKNKIQGKDDKMTAAVQKQNTSVSKKTVEKNHSKKDMLLTGQSVLSHLETRDQAYEILGAIADYLSKVEPHSPTPYLIRRAVSWGNMPLGDVMADLTKEGADLQSALTFLGMNKSQ